TAHKTAYDDAAGSKYALNGNLDVTDALTITGVSSAATIIDGGAKDLIFTINPFNVSTGKSVNTDGFVASISHVTLRNGHNASDDGANGLAEGGAIWWDAGFNGA